LQTRRRSRRRCRRSRSSPRWESFAQTDAEFYIWTDVAKGDDFFASGKRDAERILELVAPHLRRHSVALEIGCGVGRLAIPISRGFDALVAVDISPTMLGKLSTNCRSASVDNIRPFLARDRWEAEGPIGFAYSHIVFQHIPEWNAIVDYFRRVSGALAPDGVFYAQFDTRPRTLAYHVKTALPDPLLPRAMQRGVRRIRRSRESVHELAGSCGLTLASETGHNTTENVFVFTRA
jgi:SAM-dependent methyltransferase